MLQIRRVVRLGFEVRVELELPRGEVALAQLTRGQTGELELARGDIVYVRPPAREPVGAGVGAHTTSASSSASGASRHW